MKDFTLFKLDQRLLILKTYDLIPYWISIPFQFLYPFKRNAFYLCKENKITVDTTKQQYNLLSCYFFPSQHIFIFYAYLPMPTLCQSIEFNIWGDERHITRQDTDRTEAYIHGKRHLDRRY